MAIGCFRNASAVAEHAAEYLREGKTVALIAAGERWPDDHSLRLALEDLLGSGLVADHLRRIGFEARLSPEAQAAAQLCAAAKRNFGDLLHSCVGARELAESGFEADVCAASDIDASAVVPILLEGAFTVG